MEQQEQQQRNCLQSRKNPVGIHSKADDKERDVDGGNKINCCDDEQDDAPQEQSTESSNKRKSIQKANGDAWTAEASSTPSSRSMRIGVVLHSQSSSSLSSAVAEKLPNTPTGLAVLLSILTTTGLVYEKRLQRSLTCPPSVYGQCLLGHDTKGPLRDIYTQMTLSPQSILVRDIQPSLFVGTRNFLATMAAYLSSAQQSQSHLDDDQSSPLRFREIVTMTQDGAKLALDWELPPTCGSSFSNIFNKINLKQSTTAPTNEKRKRNILHGPIHDPVVLILPGINNDTSFGYMRSMMRACTNRGWIAVGMNFRGCGGIALSTPRVYTGAYTGDIRCVVQILSGRMASITTNGDTIMNCPFLFLVGHSMSGCLLTKYLGEEGLSRTLPSCVAGGAALGNPMMVDTLNINWIFSPLMALGLKKTLLENWASLRQMQDPTFQSAIRRAFLAVTLADFAVAMAPILARNNPHYPYNFGIGYQDGISYWNDGGSFRMIRHISVPMLQVVASDDFLVYHPFRARMMYSLSNPNILIVETKCGGHLGWHELPPGGPQYGVGTSWAEAATLDFIEANLYTIRTKYAKSSTDNGTNDRTSSSFTDELHHARSRL